MGESNGIWRRAMTAFLLSSLLLASCGPPLTREQQAVQIAYDDARSRFHYSEDIRTRPPNIRDLGDRWRIEFRSPQSMVGGNPVVDVRKSDLAIVLSVEGQ